MRDIFTMKDLLQHMGIATEPADLQPDGELKLCAERIVRPEAPYRMVRTMRASVLTLGRTTRSAQSFSSPPAMSPKHSEKSNSTWCWCIVGPSYGPVCD